MIVLILIPTLLFAFIVMLLYKLSDYKWYDEFVFGELTGKDWFTRFVKFIMK